MLMCAVEEEGRVMGWPQVIHALYCIVDEPEPFDE